LVLFGSLFLTHWVEAEPDGAAVADGTIGDALVGVAGLSARPPPLAVVPGTGRRVLQIVPVRTTRADRPFVAIEPTAMFCA
jgi:hypothetical protein